MAKAVSSTTLTCVVLGKKPMPPSATRSGILTASQNVVVG
jgi:hypothetical protein